MVGLRLSVALATVAILSGCSWFSSKEVAENSAPGLKVVNVLDKTLYNDAHIAGSIQVDFEEVKDTAEKWNKQDTVVFYCSNYQCQASFESAKLLKDMGFDKVMAYEGGMEEWNRLNKEGDASYKVTGAAQEKYLQHKIEKPEHDEASSVKIITALELKELMQQAGLL